MNTTPDPRPSGNQRSFRARLARHKWAAPAALAIVLLGVYGTLQLTATPDPRVDTAPLHTVLDLLDDDAVTAATLSDVQQTITVTVAPDRAEQAYRDLIDARIEQRERSGAEPFTDRQLDRLVNDPPQAGEVYRLEAGYPVGYREPLAQQLVDGDLPTIVEPIRGESALARFAPSGMIVLIILFLVIYLLRSQGAMGKLSGGKSSEVDTPKVRFADVAGADEAVADLRDIVDYLHDPDQFTRFGARGPKGVLLEGPPGTGKTLLARAVAGEAGVPFFAVAGSDFVEVYAGRGASRIRDLFSKARKAGTAVVFVDEIDAVGRARSTNNASSGADREGDMTLVALLNEMDGFESSGIIVIAATNRADMLDDALTRPGRFDRRVSVPNPDRAGRERILALHAAGKPLADDVDLTVLAGRTTGMSGAELANVINEAAVVAARDPDGGETITARHLEEAFQTGTLGRARTSAVITGRDKAITAWHEAGHAVAALMLPDAADPVTVDIIPRGPAGGVTWMEGDDDQFLTRTQAKAKLTVALAGRAAEEAHLGGDFTQGAAGDLQSATDLAMGMVTRYGMADTLSVYTPQRYQASDRSGELDATVEQLLQDALADARQVVAEHRDKVATLAQWLLDDEHVAADRLRELRNGLRRIA